MQLGTRDRGGRRSSDPRSSTSSAGRASSVQVAGHDPTRKPAPASATTALLHERACRDRASPSPATLQRASGGRAREPTPSPSGHGPGRRHLRHVGSVAIRPACHKGLTRLHTLNVPERTRLHRSLLANRNASCASSSTSVALRLVGGRLARKRRIARPRSRPHRIYVDGQDDGGHLTGLVRREPGAETSAIVRPGQDGTFVRAAGDPDTHSGRTRARCYLQGCGRRVHRRSDLQRFRDTYHQLGRAQESFTPSPRPTRSANTSAGTKMTITWPAERSCWRRSGTSARSARRTRGSVEEGPDGSAKRSTGEWFEASIVPGDVDVMALLPGRSDQRLRDRGGSGEGVR